MSWSIVAQSCQQSFPDTDSIFSNTLIVLGLRNNSTSPGTSTAPQVSGVTPIGVLLSNQSIRFLFNTSMDTGSCAYIAGTTLTTPNAIAWATIEKTNDTLVISPNGGNWTSLGTGLIIGVENCKSKDGISQTGQHSQTYAVYDVSKTRYVANYGNDGNTGVNPSDSPVGSGPYATIGAALTAMNGALCAGLDCAILIHDGDYPVSTPIILVNGISLFGGFNSNFAFRDDYSGFNTNIRDIAGFGACGGVILNPCSAVKSNAAVSALTRVDGLKITGNLANNPFSSGIFIVDNSQPTISLNYILGGSSANMSSGIYNANAAGTPALILANTISAGSSGVNTYGIYNEAGAEADIRQNVIHGGMATNTHGIRVFNTAAPALTIINNMINGGFATNDSHGIITGFNGASLAILNNTISAGSGTPLNAYSIYVNSGSSPVISNNILFALTTGGNQHCVFEFSASASPSVFTNNDLFNCSTLYRYNNGAPSDFSLIALVNGIAGYANNISMNPNFIDLNTNWNPQSTTPCAVAEGANDTYSIALDAKFINRTVPKSMGAIEQEGCQ